ncbi:MAG: hypothetical protein COY40_04475 [Alphaproteobacteria bacterium CG_4_10_14_0_8_um_filter_53_9]|nr:MAG: hypothetical protein COY40_04475 [Alphaproteobacteria bacterium CG_4_10_14_0_8_um_filter_53_9]
MADKLTDPTGFKARKRDFFGSVLIALLWGGLGSLIVGSLRYLWVSWRAGFPASTVSIEAWDDYASFWFWTILLIVLGCSLWDVFQRNSFWKREIRLSPDDQKKEDKLRRQVDERIDRNHRELGVGKYAKPAPAVAPTPAAAQNSLWFAVGREFGRLWVLVKDFFQPYLSRLPMPRVHFPSFRALKRTLRFSAMMAKRKGTRWLRALRNVVRGERAAGERPLPGDADYTRS